MIISITHTHYPIHCVWLVLPSLNHRLKEFYQSEFRYEFNCFKGISILRRIKPGGNTSTNTPTLAYTQTTYNEGSLLGTVEVYSCYTEVVA